MGEMHTGYAIFGKMIGHCPDKTSNEMEANLFKKIYRSEWCMKRAPGRLILTLEMAKTGKGSGLPVLQVKGYCFFRAYRQVSGFIEQKCRIIPAYFRTGFFNLNNIFF